MRRKILVKNSLNKEILKFWRKKKLKVNHFQIFFFFKLWNSLKQILSYDNRYQIKLKYGWAKSILDDKHENLHKVQNVYFKSVVLCFITDKIIFLLLGIFSVKREIYSIFLDTFQKLVISRNYNGGGNNKSYHFYFFFVHTSLLKMT